MLSINSGEEVKCLTKYSFVIMQTYNAYLRKHKIDIVHVAA